MFWETLDDHRIELLKKIVNRVDIGEYYMAGGTALSLQLGLRKSVDFDFFVPHKFNTDILYAQLKELCPNEISVLNVDGRGTCDVTMEGVQVSFFEYPYDTVYEYINDEDLPNLSMASVEDIATMKALAIGSRGAKKDFFDLYEILHTIDYNVSDLVSDLHEKYGTQRDFSYIGMGLNYFEEAEQERLPETFVKYNWAEMKKSFSKIQQEFFHELREYQRKKNVQNRNHDDELEL